MPGRVARSVNALPISKLRNRTTFVQRSQAASQIDCTRRKKTAEHRKEARSRRINRRIVSLAREIREFEPVGVNGHAPIVRETQRRAGMVEMSVSKQNSAGLGAGSKPPLSRFP